MIRGTTPQLTFTVPFEPALAKRIWITFAQQGEEVFTIEKDKCEFDGNKIKTRLTQTQTLSLQSNTTVQIQIRVAFEEGNLDNALASNIITTTVQNILKDGEI